MQIIIDQSEIELAIKNHIATQVTIREGQEISIDLKAGRGENGYSATIEIGAAAAKPQAEPAGKPTITVRKPSETPQAAKKAVASEAKPAAPQADPETPSTEGSSQASEAQENAGQEASDGEGDSQGEQSAPKTTSIFGSLKPSATRNS